MVGRARYGMLSTDELYGATGKWNIEFAVEDFDYLILGVGSPMLLCLSYAVPGTDMRYYARPRAVQTCSTGQVGGVYHARVLVPRMVLCMPYGSNHTVCVSEFDRSQYKTTLLQSNGAGRLSTVDFQLTLAPLGREQARAVVCRGQAYYQGPGPADHLSLAALRPYAVEP
eukprot:1802007-Rhodomonas_salina.1